MNRILSPENVVAVLWLAAFVCALMPLAAYETQSFGLAFVLLNLAVGIAVWSRGGDLSFSKAALPFLMAGFWALALVSVLASEIPFVSFIYFCFFSVFPLSFILVLVLEDRGAFIRRAGWGLGVLFFALALFSIAQYFFLPAWLHGGAAEWPLANPNSLAGLFLIVFFAALGVMTAGPGRVYSNAGLLLAIAAFAALLTTGSRGAFYALFPALIIFIIFGFSHIKKHRRCMGILLLAALALFAVFQFAAPDPEAAPFVQLVKVQDTLENSLMTRAGLMKSTWAMITDHFWFGTGIGTFFLYYPEYRGDDVYSAGLMAHSDPLQFMSEMGVFSTVLFYAFIVVAIFKTVQALGGMPKHDARRIEILAPFCALGALAAHAHVTFHFYVLSILMLAGPVLAYWFMRVQGAEKIVSVSQSNGRMAVVSVLLVTTTAFSMALGSEIFVNRARSEIMKGNLEAFADDVNAAGRLSQNLNARALIFAATIPMGILESQPYTLPREEKEKIHAQALALLSRAQDLNPRLASSYYYQARIADILDDQDGAIEGLNKTLEIDPLHLGARRMLARIYRELGEDKKAYEILRAGLKWPYAQQNTLEYYQETAFMAVDQGDLETHQKAMRRAIKNAQAQAGKSSRPLSSGYGRFLQGE